MKAASAGGTDKAILLQAETVDSSLERINTNGVELTIEVTDRVGLTYPVIQFVQDRKQFSYDPLQREKYLRLRRILVEFRSHSRGTMARYKRKIENRRVLGGEVGQTVLARLITDGILTSSASHYFLQPDNLHRFLGISWADLRKGMTSPKLQQYLSGTS